MVQNRNRKSNREGPRSLNDMTIGELAGFLFRQAENIANLPNRVLSGVAGGSAAFLVSYLLCVGHPSVSPGIVCTFSSMLGISASVLLYERFKRAPDSTLTPGKIHSQKGGPHLVPGRNDAPATGPNQQRLPHKTDDKAR